MAGRKPTPTALKVLRGNPGRRPLPEHEPQPPEFKTFEPPKHLSTVARKEWRRVVPILVESQLLTEADITALGAYCESFAMWVEAQAKIREHGLLVMTPNKIPIQSPYVSIANKSLANMCKFLSEFGLTPASRTRLTVAPKKTGNQDEEFDAFLNADD